MIGLRGNTGPDRHTEIVRDSPLTNRSRCGRLYTYDTATHSHRGWTYLMLVASFCEVFNWPGHWWSDRIE